MHKRGFYYEILQTAVTKIEGLNVQSLKHSKLDLQKFGEVQ